MSEAPDRLRFRAPGSARRLGELLARIDPDWARDEAEGLIRAGRIRIGRRTARRVRERVDPGEAVEVVLEDDGRTPRAPTPAIGAAGSLAPSATWRVIAEAAGWRSLVLPASEGDATRTIHVRVVERRGGVALLEVAVEPPEAALPSITDLCRILADVGAPVVGDARFGGRLVDGGPRASIRAAGLGSEPVDELWPEEPVHPLAPLSGGGDPPSLRVSRATARVLARGHPWIVRDEESEPPERFAAGSLVAVIADGTPAVDGRAAPGASIGLALVENGPRISARMWASHVARPRETTSVEGRVAKALARRAGLLAGRTEPDGTDAFRLVHGEADGLPALSVDLLGERLRVLVSGEAARGIEQRVVAALRTQLAGVVDAGRPIVHVDHVPVPRSLEATGVHCERVYLLDPEDAPASPPALLSDDGDPAAAHFVRERGLRFRVVSGLEAPDEPRPGFGLFLDQRANRERLARIARERGGDWLNLFAHTGAFSVALLAAGAERVVSVDLSGPYLDWLDANLAANGFAGVEIGRHERVQLDGRRYLETRAREETFAGIVLDPPTAAAAGHRFWSERRDLEPLIERALGALEPSGWLLVTCNRRGRRQALASRVERAADRIGRALECVEPAAAGPDFPSMPGFPEGDPFEGVLVQVR